MWKEWIYGMLLSHICISPKGPYASVYFDLPFCFDEELLRDLVCRRLMLNLDIEFWIGSRLSGESREFGSDFISLVDDEVPPKLFELSVFWSLLRFEVWPVQRIFLARPGLQSLAWWGWDGLGCLGKFSSFFRVVKQNLKLLKTQLTIMIGIQLKHKGFL